MPIVYIHTYILKFIKKNEKYKTLPVSIVTKIPNITLATNLSFEIIQTNYSLNRITMSHQGLKQMVGPSTRTSCGLGLS
jgi:hypothetical protein